MQRDYVNVPLTMTRKTVTITSYVWLLCPQVLNVPLLHDKETKCEHLVSTSKATSRLLAKALLIKLRWGPAFTVGVC